MKKLILGLLLATVTVLTCAFIAGCASDLSGDLYEFEVVKAAYGNGLSAQEKEILENHYQGLNEVNAGYAYLFDSEKSYTYGKLKTEDEKKDGDKSLFASGSTTGYYKISGGKLYLLKTEKDVEKTGEDLEKAASGILEVSQGKLVKVEKDEKTGTVVKTVYKK